MYATPASNLFQPISYAETMAENKTSHIGLVGEKCKITTFPKDICINALMRKSRVAARRGELAHTRLIDNADKCVFYYRATTAAAAATAYGESEVILQPYQPIIHISPIQLLSVTQSHVIRSSANTLRRGRVTGYA